MMTNQQLDTPLNDPELEAIAQRAGVIALRGILNLAGLKSGMEPDGDPLMEIPVAAEFCGYKDLRKFMEWVRRRKVPCEQRGKRKFFFKSNLVRALKNAQGPLGGRF